MKGRSLFGLMVSLTVLSTNTFLPSKASAEPNSFFRPILPQLKRQTSVPILLPEKLPQFLLQRRGSIHLCLSEANANGYNIRIEQTPRCRGANADLIASFSAERISPNARYATPSVAKKLQSLANVSLKPGIQGFFHPLGCGSSCTPPGIQWTYQGIWYSINLYTPTQNADAQSSILVGIANSSLSQNSQIATGRSPANGRQTSPGRSPANGRQIAAGRSPATGGQTATGGSPATGGQMATGGSQNTERSLIVAANSPSIDGKTVEFGEFTSDYTKTLTTPAFIVDRVNYKDLSNGSRVLSFVVWNTGFADGVIEIRDAGGKLVEIRGVDGMRSPTSVLGSPVEYIQGIGDLIKEPKANPLGLFDLRTTGHTKKTEIKNIVIPAGGTLKFTKVGDNALRYNLAKVGMDILFDSGLPKLFEKNSSLKVKLLSAIFIKLQQEGVGNLVKDGEFITLPDTAKAVSTGSWIEHKTLDKVVEIAVKVLAEELPRYGLERIEKQASEQAQRLVAKKITILIDAAELFTKASNFYMPWYDLTMAQRLAPKRKEIIFSN